jgi:protein-S-isoprenylcysteine O-methyltransferase Ste14
MQPLEAQLGNMPSSDTIISLAIGLGGLLVAILGIWIAYLSLKTMKSNWNPSLRPKHYHF